VLDTNHHQDHPDDAYRVLVTDQVTHALIGRSGSRYQSPPQTEQQARGLIAVLLGTTDCQQRGPWRQAIAGGQRIIELQPEP
jgi:hypothetical protein